MTPLLDRIFTTGIVFLVLTTPFAFGAVQAWAYSAMKVVIFGLVVVWMAKRAMLARRREAGSAEREAEKIRNSKSEIRNSAIPLTVFLLLVSFQLIPLPPSFLQVISPQTFEVYKQSLPGWPERIPYAELAGREEGAGSRSSVFNLRSSETQAPNGAITATNAERSNATNTLKTQYPAPHTGRLFPETWFPLSVSAGLTKIDLLKFAAFTALFFLVWRYPFDVPYAQFAIRNPQSEFFVLSPEQRFLRSVIFAVLGSGLLVAAFGFIERFAWNGNVLLFVAGYDAGAPVGDTVARASGPFVNPDHFANYLSLIFPLALGCALFRTFMVPRSQQYGLRIFCGFTTFLIFTGILLSLSRGGWVSTLLGISILAWLSPGAAAGSREQRAGSQRAVPNSMLQAPSSELQAQGSSLHAPRSKLDPSKVRRAVRLSLVTVCILLIVSLFLAGQGGRQQVDMRLSDTLEQTDMGLGARVTVILKDIPKMVMDFPLFGVGLGAWPELFLHYRGGPWSTVFFREAHNDYLEVLAETGFIGFGLLAMFFFIAGKRLVRGLRKSSRKYLPLIAAILAALGGMALHEWLDFSLQIPANAFLFTVLVALGMRLAKSREQGARSNFEFRNSDFELASDAPRETIVAGWSEINDQQIRNPQSAIRNSGFLRVSASRLTPYAAIAASAFLIMLAITQDKSTYPYNLIEMTSLAEARDLLLQHPTHSPYHFSVVRLAGPKAPLEWQLTEAKAALWNEPVNPYYRDFYAAMLMTMGRTAEGLKEVTRSVAESPSLSTHAYLSPENMPSLNEAEQAAVERGFKQALSRSYPEALAGLAEFYAKFNRFPDQAALYEEAARKEAATEKKIELLMNGGLAYLKAGSKEQGAGSGEQSVSGSKLHARSSTLSPDGVQAERLFREAITLNPKDPKPYHLLLTEIFAARNDLDGAKELVSKGVENGAPPLPLYLSLADAMHKADSASESKAALELAGAQVEKLIQNGESPYSLYMSLADGARSAGDRDQESAALLKALDREPRSPETLMRLANVYMEKQNYDRAAMYLNRVTDITPNSADLFYRIAQAEEAGYRFAAAGRAYARALELAPKNEGYRERYEAFRERVENNRVTSEHGAGSMEPATKE